MAESGLSPTTWAELEHCAGSYLTAFRGTWEPATTTRKLAALRAFGKYSGHPEFLRLYRRPTAARPVPHPLPGLNDDVIAMAEATHVPELQALVALCGLCGCRVGEAIEVRPLDVDYGAKSLTIRGKGDKTRIVPIPPEAFLYITPALGLALERGTTLVNRSDSGAREAITRLGERAGVRRSVSSHDLRATFATVAYGRSGEDVLAVMRLLGHANVDTTAVYVGTAWADMVTAVGG